jgi:hypothetical protein
MIKTTLDNVKLNRRFIAGSTVEEALKKYSENYKNSGFIIGIIDEIRNKEFKNEAYKNQRSYFDYVKKYKKLSINFYSIGGAILQEKCLISFYKSILDCAKKYNLEFIILTSPEELFYEKYLKIMSEIIRYINKINFEKCFISIPVYKTTTEKDIIELKQNGKYNIALVCGGFRIYDSMDKNIIPTREQILNRYLFIREKIYKDNFTIIDQTNNFALRRKLIELYGSNITVNYFYGTNNADIVFGGYNQNVLLLIGPDYKRAINYTIRRNNDNSSHE